MSSRQDELGSSRSLRHLRDDAGVDQTLQNLLRGLTLSLELRSRYRVFEFEATQDGHADAASLFRELRQVESRQIASLMDGLRARLGVVDEPRPEGVA